MSEKNLEIISDDETSQEDTTPLVKAKKTRGRPKVDHSNDPPKPNGRKVRSEKQMKAWEETQKLNREVREELKRRKQLKLATLYMESKASKTKPEPESEVDESEVDESEPEVIIKKKPKTKKPKAKPKKVKKVVYISESDTETESDTDTDESESEPEPDIKHKYRNKNKKVYIEREQPVAAFNPHTYFV
jgi:hypothetical protein